MVDSFRPSQTQDRLNPPCQTTIFYFPVNPSKAGYKEMYHFFEFISAYATIILKGKVPFQPPKV